MSKYKMFTDSERKKLIRGMYSYIRKYHGGEISKDNLKAALQWVSLDKLGRPQYNLSNWILVAFGVNKNLTIKRPVPVIPGINDGADQWGRPVKFNNRKKSERSASKIETAIQQIIAKSGAKKAGEIQKITAEVAKKMAENEAMLADVRKNQMEIKSLLKSIAA